MKAKCKICGAEYNAKSIHIKTGRSKFCSIPCKNKGHSIKMKGENHPRWKNRVWGVPVKCKNCGGDFMGAVSSIKNGRSVFCSLKCLGAWNSKYRTGENAAYWKGGRRKVICEICDNTFYLYPSQNGRFCSKECARKGTSGSNCHLWKGGITTKNHIDRTCREYKQWRALVFKRDSFACQKCGDSRGGNLNAHHIKPFAIFPELRFNVNNGITLCEKCHILEHK